MENQEFSFSLEKLQQIIDGNLPADKEYKDFIISVLEKKDHKLITLDDIYSVIDETIEKQAETANKKVEFLKKMLVNAGLDGNDIKKITGTVISLENMSLMLLSSSIKVNLKNKVGALVKRLEVMPSVERTLQGKIPKAKKPDQINAEEWVKEVWKKHPDVTQGQMAIDVKDALDLRQTIKTITGWIKPLDPQKGKRKRKPKNY